MPVVLVLLVLVNLAGPAADSGVADASGTGAPRRAELPVLPVDVPPVTAEADAACPALMESLPLELAGEQSRRVDSASPFAYAWGDPAVVLVCGVDRPASYVVSVGTIAINDVEWFVDTGDPDETVWTTVNRAVYVQLTLPPETDSAPVTALGPTITATLAYREPDPGD